MSTDANGLALKQALIDLERAPGVARCSTLSPSEIDRLMEQSAESVRSLRDQLANVFGLPRCAVGFRRKT